MLLKDSNSKTLLFLRNMRRAYLRFEDRCGKIYQNSRAYEVGAGFWQGTKINFRPSFLGRITEPDNSIGPAVFEHSASLKWIIGKYNLWTQKTQAYFSASALNGITESLKEDFTTAPVKTGGIIIFTATLINILLSLLFHKEINLLGWCMRIVFLGVSFGGLFCNASWKQIEKGSKLLSILNHSRPN